MFESTISWIIGSLQSYLGLTEKKDMHSEEPTEPPLNCLVNIPEDDDAEMKYMPLQDLPGPPCNAIVNFLQPKRYSGSTPEKGQDLKALSLAAT